MASYFENIESVEKKIIPEEINSVYKRIFELMCIVRNEYVSIYDNDYHSYDAYKTKFYVKNENRAFFEQLKALIENEDRLLQRERALEEKLLNNTITNEEYKLLSSIQDKKLLILKNKHSISKRLNRGNSKINEYEDKRLNNETNIEKSKKVIKESIDELIELLNKVEKENLGIDRLNGLMIKENHIGEFNNIIKTHRSDIMPDVPVSDSIITSIDSIFKNSLEIRIGMYKDIYKEAYNFVDTYKKHDEYNFNKINEISKLYASSLGNKSAYSIFPYTNINDDERHFNEYAFIVEQVNKAYKGELSQDEIRVLYKRVEKEANATDMSHNFLVNNGTDLQVSDLCSFLGYVIRRTDNNTLKI